jgi:hypothetical protein
MMISVRLQDATMSIKLYLMFISDNVHQPLGGKAAQQDNRTRDGLYFEEIQLGPARCNGRN